MDTKMGIKTSSFWMVLLLNAIGLVTAVQGLANPALVLILLALLNTGYATLRSIEKIKKDEVVKPGYQTSEFILVAIYNVVVGMGTLSGKIPANIAMPLMTVLTIVYNTLRQLVSMAAKAAGTTVNPEVPEQLPKPADATIATTTTPIPKQ